MSVSQSGDNVLKFQTAGIVYLQFFEEVMTFEQKVIVYTWRIS